MQQEKDGKEIGLIVLMCVSMGAGGSVHTFTHMEKEEHAKKVVLQNPLVEKAEGRSPRE